jgi:DNA-binding protein HU-beta
LNKTQLVRELRLNGMSKPDAKEAVETIISSISRSLAAGERVTIRNFGKFEPRRHKAATRVNPLTGDAHSIPEKRSVGFVPAPALKVRLNRD